MEWMFERDLRSTFGNFLTTVLMLDSRDLSERNDGFDLVSPQAGRRHICQLNRELY